MLYIKSLSKTYGLDDRRKSEIKALEDINLEIPQGEFFSVIGPTGLRSRASMTA